MKKNIILICIFILFNSNMRSENPLYFCTAASSAYYSHLLNLIGSIHANNFDQLGEIAVFDLGLNIKQVRHINRIKKVKIYKLERKNPEIKKNLGWFAWKPVIIKQAIECYPYVLYVDAGTTILKPLDHLFNYIENNQYFICTIGNEWIDGAWRHPICWGTTPFVRKVFKLDEPDNQWILSQEFVMGGVIGVTRQGFEQVIKELYEYSKDMRYFKDAKDFKDETLTADGFVSGRHDQTLLSITAYLKRLKIFKVDYTQGNAIILPSKELENRENSFYITWHPDFVSDKTHIYSSRGDLKNSLFYNSKIRYK